MYTTSAYLIHRINWRDSSAIGHFLTPDGMLSVMLKGARRTKSPLASGLRPFVHLQLTCTGRSQLKTACSLECLHRPKPMGYLQNACGLYANELIHGLANDDSDPGVFAAYAQLMQALPNAVGTRLEWLMRHFERQLLASCGYAISMPDGADDNDWCVYASDTGLQVSPKPSARQTAIPAANWRLFLQGQQTDNHYLPAFKRIMRQCVEHALGGKKLRSRELLKPGFGPRRP